MNRYCRICRLFLFSALVVAPGSAAWGQDPPYEEVVPGPPYINNHVVPVPAEAALDHCGDVPAKPHWHLFPRIAEKQPVRTAVHDDLHRHGLDCYADISTLGCTSCASELTFIFGSCRAFFGDPCALGGGLNHPNVPSYVGGPTGYPTVPPTYGTSPYGGPFGLFGGKGCGCGANGNH